MAADQAVDVAVTTVLPAQYAAQAGALHSCDADTHERGTEGLESREHRSCARVTCPAWWWQRDRRDARIHLRGGCDQLACSRQRRDPPSPPTGARSTRRHRRCDVSDWLAPERDRSDDVGDHVQLVLPPRIEPRRVARKGAVAA